MACRWRGARETSATRDTSGDCCACATRAATPSSSCTAPAPQTGSLRGSREAGITGFSHIGLRTTDAARDETFWTRVCNARVSDRIGAAPLLRIDAVHHKLALFPSTHAGVQHVNHQVAGVDDVMRAYYFLRERGVRIVFGPGRHPTSSAIFLYFEGPDGMVYEYSTGVRLIEDEAGHRPRQFPFEPEPHMQNDAGSNGNCRGRCLASSSIRRTPVEYSYTMPSGPSKYRKIADEVGCRPGPNTMRTSCSRRKYQARITSSTPATW